MPLSTQTMQMTAVYSCVRILAEAVAGLPVHLYKYNASGGKEKALSHPLYFVLHDEPNPEMSSFVFRETLMTPLLLWGNAYAQIIRNGQGKHPWKAEVNEGDEGVTQAIINGWYSEVYEPTVAASGGSGE